MYCVIALVIADPIGTLYVPMNGMETPNTETPINVASGGIADRMAMYPAYSCPTVVDSPSITGHSDFGESRIPFTREISACLSGPCVSIEPSNPVMGPPRIWGVTRHDDSTASARSRKRPPLPRPVDSPNNRSIAMDAATVRGSELTYYTGLRQSQFSRRSDGAASLSSTI